MAGAIVTEGIFNVDGLGYLAMRNDRKERRELDSGRRAVAALVMIYTGHGTWISLTCCTPSWTRGSGMPDMNKSQSGTAVGAAVDAVAPPTEVDSAPGRPAGPAPQDKPRSPVGRRLVRAAAPAAVLDLGACSWCCCSASRSFPGLFTGADPQDGDLTNHFLTKPRAVALLPGRLVRLRRAGPLHLRPGHLRHPRLHHGRRRGDRGGDHVRRLAGHAGRLLRRLDRRDHLPDHRHLLRSARSCSARWSS